MESLTPRFALPQIVVSQAHKEVTHNEALALVDALLHPVIEGIADVPPTLGVTDAGKCWAIGTVPVGEFSGKASQLACWTGQSWRFAPASDGMRLWHRVGQHVVYFLGQQWTVAAPVSLPSGGATIDAEARLAVSNLVQRLEQAGVIRSA